ncbi:MAG TPA: peptidoglycan DD-metalloendopeptidase family protein [Bacilli bacterium]|nr:peptidoglycan DD-metalloendopeptidase family protein [Bacilli bacterium]
MKRLKLMLYPLFMIAALLFALQPQTASAAPSFQMPFPCGQVWEGQTRTNHSPANAIDLNRTDDFGDKVVAAAAGTVVTVANLGDTSYGRYVVIDHGGGWKTYYAHLSSFAVSKGQWIAKGDKVGNVGSSGGSTGPHLHFEERYNGVAQKVVWNGSQAYYWGSRSYTSHNTCGSNATGTVNTAGADLNIRSGPGTGYSIVGQVSDGQKVTIYCQAHGSTVTGTYGTSNIWDRIGSGKYISDTYVYTGSDGLVAPLCN